MIVKDVHHDKHQQLKQEFAYDAATDSYTCPQGHRLIYRKSWKNKRSYRISAPKLCRGCPLFGVCTKSTQGRSLWRFDNEALREKLSGAYQSQRGQALYARRGEKVEHVFGHVKRNLESGHFLLRGLASVRAEWSVTAT